MTSQQGTIIFLARQLGQSVSAATWAKGVAGIACSQFFVQTLAGSSVPAQVLSGTAMLFATVAALRGYDEDRKLFKAWKGVQERLPGGIESQAEKAATWSIRTGKSTELYYYLNPVKRGARERTLQVP